MNTAGSCATCGELGVIAWGRCYDCASKVLVRGWAWTATILLGAFLLVLVFLLLNSGFSPGPGPGPLGWP